MVYKQGTAAVYIYPYGDVKIGLNSCSLILSLKSFRDQQCNQRYSEFLLGLHYINMIHG